MRLEKPFPFPELWPDVPHRLARMIERYYDERTIRVEILVADGTRLERINVITMDDVPATHEDVAALAIACADAHAMGLGRSGKYRAVLVRKVGEQEHRKATFDVDLEHEARRRQYRWSRTANPWVNLAEGWHRLGESMVRFHDRAMDRLMKQRRIRQEQDEAMLQVLLSELLVLYQEGLRMQADSAREITEQRMQARLHQARAQLDARVWEAFAPVLEAAAAWLGQGFEGRQGAAGATADGDGEQGTAGDGEAIEPGEEHDAASEPDGEREEGAPPLPDDAPSSGKVRSGA